MEDTTHHPRKSPTHIPSHPPPAGGSILLVVWGCVWPAWVGHTTTHEGRPPPAGGWAHLPWVIEEGRKVYGPSRGGHYTSFDSQNLHCILIHNENILAACELLLWVTKFSDCFVNSENNVTKVAWPLHGLLITCLATALVSWGCRVTKRSLFPGDVKYQNQ